MKLCIFDNRLGVVEDDTVRDVTPVLDRLPAYGGILTRHDPLIAPLPELLPAIRDAAADVPTRRG